LDTLLEQIVADFQERPLPPLTRRRVTLPRLPGKADVVIGMRRTGKTYFLYQAVAEAVAAGTPKEAMLYVNFDDERLQPLTGRDLHRVVDAYYRLYPTQRATTAHLFFDEIQNIAGWEPFVRRLLDTEQVQVCLTGSSAKLLSREIATSLRGRSLTTEIFPFSFAEALAHQGVAPPTAGDRPGAKARSLLENRLRSYLFTGGFPEVQGVDEPLRIRILQEYVDVVILRDVAERHAVANLPPLRALIRHLLAAPATLFSVNKFYNDLRSQGIACGKNTLHAYLDHITDAYLVFTVPIHSRSERTRRINPRKVYCVDPGLAASFCRRPHPDAGRLLENLCFLELRRRNVEIEYYRNGRGEEVDFLSTDLRGTRTLTQVALEITDPATRKRELRALAAAMDELHLDHATLVTLNDEERVTTDAGTIDIVPAWQWCLAPAVA